MAYRNWKVGLGAVVLLLGLSSTLIADTNGSQPNTSVKKYGVAWNVAEDRKIENINGVYQPEDLDKYMKRYFEQLFSKVNELSAKMDRLSDQVMQVDAEIKALTKAKDVAPRAKLV